LLAVQYWSEIQVRFKPVGIKSKSSPAKSSEQEFDQVTNCCGMSKLQQILFLPAIKEGLATFSKKLASTIV